jgi:hypothetical protein
VLKSPFAVAPLAVSHMTDSTPAPASQSAANADRACNDMPTMLAIAIRLTDPATPLSWALNLPPLLVIIVIALQIGFQA